MKHVLQKECMSNNPEDAQDIFILGAQSSENSQKPGQT